MINKSRSLYYGVLILIFGPLLARFFTENFHISYAIMPLFDVLCILLAIAAIITYPSKIRINFLFLLTIGMLIMQLVSLHINDNLNVYGLLISARSFYRLIFALLLGYLVLDRNNYKSIIKYLEWLLIINGLVMTYQYFFLGLSQDIIGGTFGNSQGVNEIQNVLCCYILVYEVLNYLNKKSNSYRMAFYTILTIYICALAEITVFFFELVVIFVLAFMLSNSGISILKKLLFLVLGFVILIVGIKLYLLIFPERAFLLSYNNIFNYLGGNVLTGNTGVYRISRIHPFLQLEKIFFNNNLMKWLGLGLGNCASNTSFYSFYGPLLHYDWLSSSIIFLENGYLGVIFFLSVIGYIFIDATIFKNKFKKNSFIIWVDYVRILSVINIILFFYNNSLMDIYTSYTVGLLLSSFFVLKARIKSSVEVK